MTIQDLIYICKQKKLTAKKIKTSTILKNYYNDSTKAEK